MNGVEFIRFVLESAGKMELILASNSPRRFELGALLEFVLQVIPADIDETPLLAESPRDYVVRLAATKALWVSSKEPAGSLVIAADTAVVDGNQILGKPADGLEAEAMLQQLRGRIHQVHSGVAVVVADQLLTEWCCTDVPMRQYTDDEIRQYIDSGDPLDKAGSYAIQHPVFHPVENLEGCYANVMGLPLCHLTRVLRKFNLDPHVDVPKNCQDHIGYACPVFRDILGE